LPDPFELVQVTLMAVMPEPSVRTVVPAFAVYEPPPLTLTVSLVEASAGATLIPTTAAAAAAVNRTLPARFLIVMTALLDRGSA
jgi:hypothetical protein